MSGNLNQTNLIGRLGNDPELRYTQNQTPVCNFSLATTEKFKQGDDWKEETEWHRVVVYGKAAENCNKYLRKGSSAYICGKNKTRSWENKEGFTVYTTEVIAREVQFLGSKNDNANSNDPAPQPDSSGGSPY